jgi:hypothetical protein
MSGRAGHTARTASSVCVRWSRPAARASSRTRRTMRFNYSFIEIHADTNRPMLTQQLMITKIMPGEGRAIDLAEPL